MQWGHNTGVESHSTCLLLCGVRGVNRKGGCNNPLNKMHIAPECWGGVHVRNWDQDSVPIQRRLAWLRCSCKRSDWQKWAQSCFQLIHFCFVFSSFSNNVPTRNGSSLLSTWLLRCSVVYIQPRMNHRSPEKEKDSLQRVGSPELLCFHWQHCWLSHFFLPPPTQKKKKI